MAIRERTFDDNPAPGGASQAAAAATASSTPSGPAPVSQFRRALEDYRDALQSTWRHQDAHQRLREAWHTELLRTVQAPAPDYATYMEQAAGFARRTQQAWLPTEATERFNAAFTSYLNSVREGWAKMDTESVQPADLALIAFTLYEAANLLAVPLSRKPSQ
jgi:hypothetical protein